MPYSKIIVGYDGSEQSVRALRSALELSSAFKALIEVVHVYNLTPIVVGETVAGSPPAATESMKLEAETVAAEARTIISSVTDTPIEVLIAEGDPGKTITSIAADRGSDLIVVGSHGKGGFKELFTGSVSHYVTQHAKVPVLVVK
ncbi:MULTISPECIES: universal stress protein [unclassified Paenibacillus]|uniref:universal stress protein n=1 Tax=unclassified Paenibacillus TaxID=185978 RepID=UPI000955A2A2|nr:MULTISPECIES: universal stress protein [unclassified Paenibacillus]ASS67182.1 universal stress protein [Paenibacillus sp. RUD330]SIQ86866.1 Nucleotide-binding universal stress protein, UspA family [Paenibacillus sp. RU4X]SIR08161.1 Nucleotide-binding universal stress protein, UspA family [Paenibacillus sp. RU4T]